MKFWLALICILTLLHSGGEAHGQVIVGKVVSVADGDTITILTASKQTFKIRLLEIDAPEKSQPYGARAKKELSSIVYNKMVSIHTNGKDRYGRLLGRVYIGNKDVNLAMVSNGYAWAYTKYLTDPSIRTAENKAKKLSLGLWGLPSDKIIPPWEWRKSRKNK